MTIAPSEFLIPDHPYDSPGLRHTYYNRMQHNPSEFFTSYKPCLNCLLLAICLNKRDMDILYCPIVVDFFYWHGINMKVNTSRVIDIKYFDLLFWIIKVTDLDAYVELIVDNEVQFVSVQIDLTDGSSGSSLGLS